MQAAEQRQQQRNLVDTRRIASELSAFQVQNLEGSHRNGQSDANVE